MGAFVPEDNGASLASQGVVAASDRSVIDGHGTDAVIGGSADGVYRAGLATDSGTVLQMDVFPPL